MKKTILLLFAIVFAAMANAQELKFAYFSYDAALKSMPDYGLALVNVDKLRTQYDNEIKRAENEFNAKYEDFLENQRSLAPAILDKRQAELQEMLQMNLKFKEEAKRLLKQAEDDAYTPLKNKLNAAVKKIGAERGYAFILNTDNNACPYVDSTKGDDISVLIEDALK
ncbi:MAG TPA: hypothetical protein DEQ27_03965 [Prevotella sp.]|nr:hypothetical protein [Prevotella sp.]